MESQKKLLNLITSLIEKSNLYTKEVKSRLKLNMICNEFENKATNKFNYFIRESSERYKHCKFGSKFKEIINTKLRENNGNINDILKDDFFTKLTYDKEKNQIKKKINVNIIKDIKNTCKKIKRENTEKVLYVNKLSDNKIDKENKLCRDMSSYNVKSNIKTGILKIGNCIEEDINNLEKSLDEYRYNVNSSGLEKIEKADYQEGRDLDKKAKIKLKLPKLKFLEKMNLNSQKDLQIKKTKNVEIDNVNLLNVLCFSHKFANENNIKKVSRNKSVAFNENNDEKAKFLPFITEVDKKGNKINYYKSYEPTEEFQKKISLNERYKNTINTVLYSCQRMMTAEQIFSKKADKFNNLTNVDEIPDTSSYEKILTDERIKFKQNRFNHYNKNDLYMDEREKMNKKIDSNLQIIYDYGKKYNVLPLRLYKNKINYNL